MLHQAAVASWAHQPVCLLLSSISRTSVNAFGVMTVQASTLRGKSASYEFHSPPRTASLAKLCLLREELTLQPNALDDVTCLQQRILGCPSTKCSRDTSLLIQRRGSACPQRPRRRQAWKSKRRTCCRNVGNSNAGNFEDDGAHDRDVCDCCPDVPLDTEWLAATCARPVTVGCPGLRLTVNRRETHLTK